MALHVAILADEYLAREALREWLVTAGHRASVLDPSDLSPAPLRRIAPDLVLLDADTRRIAVSRAVSLLVEALPGTSVVLLADPASVPRALRSIEAGAFDFVEKPARPEKLYALLHKAERYRRLCDENRTLRARLGGRNELCDVIGSPAAAERLDALFDRLAPGCDPVLVTGERGTGKALLARILHARAGGDDDTFVEADAGLLCGEAFWRWLTDGVASAVQAAGAGAPGARRAHVSVCVLAVETLPLADRERLVATTREGRWCGLAGTTDAAVRVRPVVTARVPPEVLEQRGLFSVEDLAALGGVRVHLPALREGGADVLRLAERLLARAGVSAGRTFHGFDVPARRALLQHSWEGNVRELMAVVDHAAALCTSDEVGVEHLPGHLLARPALLPDGTGPRTLREVEHAHILRTLTQTRGNKVRAARLLGINRMTLYNKLREIQGDVEGARGASALLEDEP